MDKTFPPEFSALMAGPASRHREGDLLAGRPDSGPVSEH
jgi:hypothetical protein